MIPSQVLRFNKRKILEGGYFVWLRPESILSLQSCNLLEHLAPCRTERFTWGWGALFWDVATLISMTNGEQYITWGTPSQVAEHFGMSSGVTDLEVSNLYGCLSDPDC